MTRDDIELREVQWSDPGGREALMALRMAIFVVEQGVPEDMEIDDEDPASRHFLAVDSSGIVACTMCSSSSG